MFTETFIIILDFIFSLSLSQNTFLICGSKQQFLTFFKEYVPALVITDTYIAFSNLLYMTTLLILCKYKLNSSHHGFMRFKSTVL
jgi:hypothetical protein